MPPGGRPSGDTISPMDRRVPRPGLLERFRLAWRLWRLTRAGAFGPSPNQRSDEVAEKAVDLAVLDEPDEKLASRLLPLISRRGVTDAQILWLLREDGGDDPKILRRAVRLVRLAADQRP